jgi:hypothetical protein
MSCSSICRKTASENPLHVDFGPEKGLLTAKNKRLLDCYIDNSVDAKIGRANKKSKAEMELKDS